MVVVRLLLHTTVVNMDESYLVSTVLLMARRVEVSQLVGAAEIATRLGVALPQTIHDWRRRHEDFPSPVAVLTMGMIWNWPDVEEWALRTGRLK
jgi:hypothetical protein